MHGGGSDDTFYVDNVADRAMEVPIDGTGDISVYAYNVAAYGIYLYITADGSASVTSGGAIDVVAYIGQGAGIYVAGDGAGDTTPRSGHAE